ncbi:MAG: TlpA disulfide reductase family protein [Gammaproteobacteria bacterium]|nr:TlpA disulfide reductase family protein [Gammaproteobacteria bacterium]
MNTLSVSLGPFALSSSLLLLLSAALVALVAARLVARGQPGIAGTISDMFIVGAVVARIVFVVLWFDIYRDNPWTMLDVRDGGFSAWPGLAAALLLAIWRGWHQIVLRRQLIIGLGSGILIWGLLFSALKLLTNPALPAVPLTTLTGESAELTVLAVGKPMVINLWASWCPPCRREMPVLEVAQKHETGVQFVFINQGEQAGTANQFLRSSKLDLANVLIDPGAHFGHAVGSGALPTTLFYDAAGRMQDSHLGELSAATLASKLNQIRNINSHVKE